MAAQQSNGDRTGSNRCVCVCVCVCVVTLVCSFPLSFPLSLPPSHSLSPSLSPSLPLTCRCVSTRVTQNYPIEERVFRDEEVSEGDAAG